MAIAAGGCSSPASPPGPPAEIPALVVFPASITIDVSSIASTSREAGPAALVGSGGEFSEIIASGGDMARILQEDVLEGFLFPFTQFDIPVGTAVSKFEGDIAPQGPDVLPQSFKFDFGDFDFDNDGSPEGCTGCTCPLGCAPALKTCPSEAAPADLRPVCFRIWIQRDPSLPFERVMAGVFDALPTPDDPETDQDEENPGKGRFHGGVVHSGEVDGSVATDRFLVGVVYDHRVPGRPSDRSTEAFLINDFVQDGVIQFSNNLHIDVTQTGRIDPAGKEYLQETVRSTERQTGIGDSGIPNDFFQQYIGRFRDDADFWNGSVFARDQGIVTRNVTDVCARISTGNGSPPLNCVDLDIDTTGEAFLGTAEEADVIFSDDFPVLPTF